VLAATAILAIWLAAWFGVERFIRGSSPANLGTFVKLMLVGTLIGWLQGTSWHLALLGPVVATAALVPLIPLFDRLAQLFAANDKDRL